MMKGQKERDKEELQAFLEDEPQEKPVKSRMLLSAANKAVIVVLIALVILGGGAALLVLTPWVPEATWRQGSIAHRYPLYIVGNKDNGEVAGGSSKTPTDENSTEYDNGKFIGKPVFEERSPDIPVCYHNARFDYSVVVPGIFTLHEESMNGDGCYITNSELEMTITVSGMNNIFDWTTQQCLERELQGREASYQFCSDDMFIISYSENGMFYYIKEYVGEDYTNQIRFRYPESRAAENDPVREQIVATFTPGDLV